MVISGSVCLKTIHLEWLQLPITTITKGDTQALPAGADRPWQWPLSAPLALLNSRSGLLSGGVVGFWLKGKRNFRLQQSWEKDTRFYTFNRSATKGEIVAFKVKWGMQLFSFSPVHLEIYLSLQVNSLKNRLFVKKTPQKTHPKRQLSQAT